MDLPLHFTNDDDMKPVSGHSRQRKHPASSTGSKRSNNTPDSTGSTLTPTKSKQRSEECRQRALIACRDRRTAESALIQDLGLALPITAPILKSCDKLAVLRLASSYVKLRAVLQNLQLCNKEEGYDESLLQSLGGDSGLGAESLLLDSGFLLVLSTVGEIIYVSDNVSESLRCEKHSVHGTNIYDYICEPDHVELDRLLSVQNMSTVSPTKAPHARSREGHVLKAPRGTATVHLREGGGGVSAARQQALRITGKVFLSTTTNACAAKATTSNFFVGVAEPLSPPSLSMLGDPSDCTFPFPHFEVSMMLDWVCTADLKVVSFDIKMGQPADGSTTGSSDLAGVSVFEFIHAEDMIFLRDGLKAMYTNGGTYQSKRGYRMLSHTGGWVWTMTQASTMEVPVGTSLSTSRSGSDENHTGHTNTRAKTVTYCVGRHFFISDFYDRDVCLTRVQLDYRGGTSPVLSVPPSPNTLAVFEQPAAGSALTELQSAHAYSPDSGQEVWNDDDGFIEGFISDLSDTEWLDALYSLTEAESSSSSEGFSNDSHNLYLSTESTRRRRAEVEPHFEPSNIPVLRLGEHPDDPSSPSSILRSRRSLDPLLPTF